VSIATPRRFSCRRRPNDPAAFRPAIADITDRGAVSRALNVIAETVPALRSTGGGAIVNFASIDAFAVSAGQLLYSAAKAAVVSLTRSLAIELGDDQISVNAVAPGWVDTPGTRAAGRLERAVATIPFRRAAHPTEIADWVWMLSQGTYMTGETIVVSGGLVVR
jgi:3-oxoacyl-[acyl-carrier protein] reductase